MNYYEEISRSYQLTVQDCIVTLPSGVYSVSVTDNIIYHTNASNIRPAVNISQLITINRPLILPSPSSTAIIYTSSSHVALYSSGKCV